MTYPESIDWLYSTQLFGIKLGLDGPRQLLREFDACPSDQTTVIQIAGTNGKGSTANLLDSLIRSTGQSCGLFTSPHLIHYRERIRVNGEMISEETCTDYILALKELVQDWEHHPTFFELTLALAMRHFIQQDCRYIILETGMGGRLDATTAVPNELSLITPIGLDHTQWLGDTLTAIATEKGGIIRSETPVISSSQETEAAQVIRQIAREKRAPLTFVTAPLEGYPINLPGLHQQHNAALALEAAHQLNLPLNSDLIRQAMNTVTHAGRFEIIPQENEQAPIILDAAHNPHAAKTLLHTWQRQFPDTKARVIFAAVESKDISTLLDLIAPIIDEIHLVPANTPRALPTETLHQALPEFLQQKSTQHPTLESALNHLNSQNSKNQPTLITGSIFLLGQAKALLEKKSHRPSTQ